MLKLLQIKKKIKTHKLGRCCNESDWYNFNNIKNNKKNNFYYLICKDYIVKFIVCISNTTQQYI